MILEKFVPVNQNKNGSVIIEKINGYLELMEKFIILQKKGLQMTRILHLTLKKKWFDLIRLGKKTTEYREIKPYWSTRLLNQEFDEVHFRNGYNPKSPFMRVEWKKLEKEEFMEHICYAIRLGKILEVSNV
jgi:hypothetical protein